MIRGTLRSLALAGAILTLAASCMAGQTPPAAANSIVFVSGPSGSGKSQVLHELWTRRTDRVVSIDFMGEVPARNPDAIRTFGWRELREALAAAARHDRWHIAAVLDDSEIPKLFHVLAPPFTSAESSSYTRELGGVAVECGECALIAPNGRTAKEIRGAFLRGRHHQLSLYMATQRPQDVDRCVTSQAQTLLTFRTHEQVELDYWRKKTSPAIADVIAALPQFHSVYLVPGDNRVRVIDARYRVVRTLDVRNGQELAA